MRLRLRSLGHGPQGHAVLTYRPGDPDYTRILKHLGSLRPGETIPVRPFPEQWSD